MAEERESNPRESKFKLDVDCEDALKGLKAITREAKKATEALKELDERPSNKVYVVVKDEGEYPDRERTNEAVYNNRELAEYYAKQKGAIFNEQFNEWEIPDSEGYPISYHIEEWNINTLPYNK